MKDIVSVEKVEEIIISGGYLTPKQAAQYLGIKVKSLADYRSKGRKPHYIKRYNAVRYPASAITDFIIERNKVKRSMRYDQLLSTTLEHDT